MTFLEIDMQTFHYALHSSRNMIYDGDYPTGERTEGYSAPVEISGTFTTASGRASEREFGTFIDYDYIIHIEGRTCPFDENAVIWLPGTSTKDDPDAVVVRISEARSYTAIAVKKVR